MTHIRHTLASLLLLLAFTNVQAQDTTAYINSVEIIKKGSALHDQENYEEALALYQLISPNDSNYAISLAERMFTHATQGDYEKAIALGRKGITLNSSNTADFYSRLGSSLDDNEQVDEALEVFAEGYAKYPYHRSLIYNYGVTLVRAEQYELAQEMFIQRLKLSPFHSGSHYQLAEISMLQGMKAKALMAYLVYLATKPSDVEVLSRVEKFLSNELKEENTLRPFSTNGYEDIDAIILAKVAIGDTFKPSVKLDYRITRQAELLVKQLSKARATDDFWGEYYLPFYKTVAEKKQTAPFLYTLVSAVNNEDLQKWIKKNQKDINAFIATANEQLGNTKFYHKVSILGKEDTYRFWYYDDGELNAIGNSNAEGVDVGPYLYFYDNAELSAKGLLDSNGEKVGDWEYYDPKGNLTQTETYNQQAQLIGENIYYYESGNKRLIVPYVDGTASGTLKRFYECGTLKEDYLLVNNQAAGPGATYYPSGQIEVKYNMAAGELDGPYEEFYESGKKAATYHYKNGIAEGPYERYHENGQLKEKGSYKNSELHGEWEGYYDNGNVEYRTTYEEGAAVGKVVFFHKEGTKREEYEMNGTGQIHGNYHTYDTDGKLHYTYRYDSGKVAGFQYVDKQGKVLSEGNSKDSMLVKAYTAQGQRWFDSQYKNGIVNGQLTHYHANGRMKFTVAVVDNQWQGEYLEYYETGQLKVRTEYKDNANSGWHYDYYKNGQIISEAMMVDDKMEQWLIEYQPDGTLSARTYYRAGQMQGESYTYGPEGMKFSLQINEGDVPQVYYQYDKDGAIMSQSDTPQGTGEINIATTGGIQRYKAQFNCGRAEGEMVLYHDEESVDTKYTYKFGVLNGPFESFYSNGQPYSKGTMKNGLAEGRWTYYDVDGTLASESVNEAGLTQGQNKNYYTNGQMSSVCDYTDDTRDGECRYYDPEGALQMVKHYKKGIGVIDYQYPLENGQLSSPQPIARDSEVTLTAYHANGNKSYVQGYKLGWLHGKSIDYYSNGKVNEEANYKDGDNHGWSRTYYPNGQLKSEIYFEHDKENGTAKNFYTDGTLMRSVEYKHGVKHGEEIWYNEDGTIARKFLFWNNVIY